MSNVRNQGAGDYEAERDHCDASREFAEAGEVQKSPQDADPQHPQPAAGRDEGDAGRIAAGGKVAGGGHPPLETSPTTIAQPPKGN